MKNAPLTPIVKWAGGKRRLLNKIIPFIPPDITTYYEPFLGGASVLLAVQPHSAIVNDLNKDLITLYRIIKTDVENLIEHLRQHRNTPEYFYTIRSLDRTPAQYESMTDLERASRMLYLNKTCFNGLFRVNSSGQFNVPFGHYKNPNIVNEKALRDIHRYFNESIIEFQNDDFEKILLNIDDPSAFVYIDPPYDPITKTASFTAYQKQGFDKTDQIRLKECCDILTQKNIRFIASNAATDFISELYAGYNIVTIDARRSINTNSAKNTNEVIIKNFK